MRIVFVTQQVDPEHPVLAATVSKVRALAERVDEVVVLADRSVPGTLPANCRTRSFAARTRVGRGLRFTRALVAELARRPRPRAVIAHMCPIYAVLAAPLVRPFGVRVALWFTHWRRTRRLELAERLANVVVSVDVRSFPIASPKVRAIGHGIDVGEFACGDGGAAHSDLRVVALGRYSPAKGLDVVLRAAKLVLDGGLDVRLECYGPALTAEEREHRRELEHLVRELGLERRVRLEHAILRSEVPAVFARADVLVNNMRAGAPDKIVYEACAACLPVLASNPVFDDLLPDELGFDRDDPDALAGRLAYVAGMPREERSALGKALRRGVEERHSSGHWADGILEAIG